MALSFLSNPEDCYFLSVHGSFSNYKLLILFQLLLFHFLICKTGGTLHPRVMVGINKG